MFPEEIGEEAEELLRQAQQALDAGAPEEATGLARRAAEGLRDGSAGAQAERVGAMALQRLGRYSEAIAAFDRAAQRALAAGNPGLAARVQIGRIESLSFLGRDNEAIALARRLQQTLRAEGAEQDAAKVLVNLGNLHYRRDQYALALRRYEQAEAIFARGGNADARARAQANRANILTLVNRVDEAIALFESARAVFAAEGRALDAAMVDFNIGYLHHISGRYAAALAAMSRARAAFDAWSQVVETAKCDADIADVYRDLNLFPEALESYERAVETFAERGLVHEQARAELGRAAVLLARGNTEASLLALNRADDLFRAHRNALRRAYVRLVRASGLRAAGRVEEACREAEQAARVLTRGGLRDGAAEARFLPVEAALERGEDATRRMHGIAHVARRYARGWLESRAERALGLYHARRGNSARALRHLRRAAAALESARTLIAPEDLHVAFLSDKMAVYEDLIAALLQRGRATDIAESLEVVERAKSRLLLERVQAALENRAGSPADAAVSALHERLAAVRAELSRGFHRIHSYDGALENDARRFGSVAAGEAANALAPLEREYRALLREIELAGLGEARADAAPALPSVVSAAALRAALAPDETLVEFGFVGGAVCAWLLGRGGITVRQGIASGEAVAHAARRLRYHLQKAGGMAASGSAGYAAGHSRQLCAGARDVLRQLYDLLLAPLADGIDTEKIVLVPHGSLHGLPFHAFFDGAAYALDRWEIVYAPSAAVWYAGTRRAARRDDGDAGRALLVGVPGPGIEQVTVEVERLARLLPCPIVLQNERATMAAFRAAAGESRILHLATHALFRADNPLFSGLRLADGWLLARDLYEMPLRADLVTLSACRTGVTFVEPGDELFGLLRGFLSAGARALAASLWPADDAATAALMTRFYALLAQGSLSRAAALRAAQRETREQFPHPYHWAAFALVGER